MKRFTQVKPIDFLKSNAVEVVKVLSETREPMLITQNGEAKLVVTDIQIYEEQLNTLTMLRLLALGKKEADRGNFRDAEDVFVEFDMNGEL